MQITDMLGKYVSNLNSGVNSATATSGTEKLMSDIRNLAAGNVFEGTIGSIKNDMVTLLLGNGGSISARLAGDVSLSAGQSMFFMVKSNDGNTVEIKPYVNQSTGNPALWSALDAAGLQVTERNIDMVKTLMEEQMPIDKQSLFDMSKIVNGNETVSPETLVQMTKLGIPVTAEYAAQFENYKLDEHQILGKMNEILNEIPQSFDSEGMTAEKMMELNNRLMDIFNLQPEQPGVRKEEQLTEIPVEKLQPGEIQSQTAMPNQTEQMETTIKQMPQDGDLLKNLLSGEELHSLAEKIGAATGKEYLISDGKLAGMSTEQILAFLKEEFSGAAETDTKSLKDLFTGKEYRTLLQNLVENQWLVRPEELKTEDRMKDLYNNLDKQMRQMENLMKDMGIKNTELQKSVADIRNNMEFMNEINHAYTYLQIPLKMENQNAHSDLYVYTNKKNLADKDGELSAFLHLDMEHLGSTDVSVKMKGSSVNTKFYLEDDFSYNLIMRNAKILEKRLEEKGYNCSIDVENDSNRVNFVDDFLEKGKSAGHMVHRYSFDVRA